MTTFNKAQAEQTLTKIARHFLKKEFGLELTVPVEVSGRMKSVLGLFYYNRQGQPLSIKIAKGIVAEEGREVDAIETLKHECVHYALCVKGLPFSDDDQEFIDTCNRLGVPLTGTCKGFADQHLWDCKHGLKTLAKNNMRYHEKGSYYKKCGCKLTYRGKYTHKQLEEMGLL